MTADFALTDEQEMLRDTARSLVARECPITLVRSHIEDPSVVEPLWKKHLREWVALGDGPAVDLCLFLEELGAGAVPGPFFASAALALPVLRAIGDPRADELASGELTGTVAWAGTNGEWAINDDPVRTFVLEVDRTDLVVIVFPGPSGTVVDPSHAPWRQIDTLDTTRRVFELEVQDGDRQAATPIDAAALAAVLDRATVALAAEMAGTSRWLLEHTIQYAKDRHQFGVPIGSFQGLQWHIVDMSLDVERATAAAYYAAMVLDAGDEVDDAERRRAIHVAKAAAGTAARHASKVGMQVHGGIGYTWENDLHLYLRRAYASDYLLGSSDHHHDRLAELLLG